MTTAAGPVRFTTVGLPEEQRTALWEDHNADALIGLRCRTLDEATLEATEINLQLPRVHLARVIGNPHVVERTSEVIRHTPAEAIACYITLVGEAFFYHDKGVRTLRPGQLIVCDADRPFMRGFSQGLEELAIKVPRSVFTDLTGVRSLPEPLVLDVAQARALVRRVGNAVRPDAVHPNTGHPVDEETVLGLVGGLVTGRPVDLAAVHLANATSYIEDHLADPGLTAARIAKGIGISERHLSRVFAADGTSVPQYVLNRRLERARALLGRYGEATVAEIAACCGFGSTAYFSHAFKDRFGVRATDVRRSARIAESA